MLSLAQNPQGSLLSKQIVRSPNDALVTPTTTRSQNHLQLEQLQQQRQQQHLFRQQEDQQRPLLLLRNSNLQLDPAGASTTSLIRSTGSHNQAVLAPMEDDNDASSPLATIRWMNDINALPNLSNVLSSYGGDDLHSQHNMSQQLQQGTNGANAPESNVHHHVQQYEDEIISLFGRK